MTRNRLYLVFFAALTAGYGWLAWSLYKEHESHSFTPCMFKNITGIACPSCGCTRSLTALAHGHFTEAVLINPLGLVIAAIMLIVPFWLAYDVALGKDSLYRGYKTFENTLKIKWVAITLILLVLANWIWNIYKGL